MTLAITIPFRDRSLDALARCIDSIQLGGGDFIVVADQHSEARVFEALLGLCGRKGVGVVTTSTVERWSAGIARNAGARFAIDRGVDTLMFCDADIILPPGYISMAKEVVRSGHVFAYPLVAARIGHRGGVGCMMIAASDFEAMHGYDESWEGRFEDLELTIRLRRAGAVGLVAGSSMATHLDHEIEKPYDGTERLRALSARLRVQATTTEDFDINPNGWGEHTVVLEPRHGEAS